MMLASGENIRRLYVIFVAANNYQTFIIKNDDSLWISGVKDYRDSLPPSKNNLLSYFIKIQTDVKEIAVSQALANPYGPDGSFYGNGGFTQLFIPNYKD